MRAEGVANGLLERHKTDHGRYPRALALVLWGLDNIKTQGEGVAQALWLLGVRPVRDALNRVTQVEAIPLGDLKRPRIDVVMTVSGIFSLSLSLTISYTLRGTNGATSFSVRRSRTSPTHRSAWSAGRSDRHSWMNHAAAERMR